MILLLEISIIIICILREWYRSLVATQRFCIRSWCSSANCCINDPEVGEDRLSSLPEDLLLFILSLLTLREAAKTCILSHKWRHLSKKARSTLKLDFENMLGSKYEDSQFRYSETGSKSKETERRKFVLWADKVIEHFQDSSRIKSLKLQFSLDKDHTYIITRCILFTMAKRVRKFSLNLFSSDSIYLPRELDRNKLYEFPCWIFEHNYLEDMSLNSCSLLPTSNLKGFGSLVKLKLNFVFIDDASLVNVLNNTPNLEQLFLISCWEIRNLTIGPSSCRKLKFVSIRSCWSMRKVAISAIQLIRFEYQGVPVDFHFARAPCLVQFYLYFYQGYLADECSDPMITLPILSKDVPRLESLHLLFLQPDKGGPGLGQLPMLANLRHLVLEASPLLESLFSSLSLMCACPNLVKFEIHAFLDYKTHTDKPPNCTFHNLEEVIITRVKHSSHIEFAKYLICNSPNLKSMTFSNEHRVYRRRGKYNVSKGHQNETIVNDFFQNARQQLQEVVPLGAKLSFVKILG